MEPLPEKRFTLLQHSGAPHGAMVHLVLRMRGNGDILGNHVVSTVPAVVPDDPGGSSHDAGCASDVPVTTIFVVNFDTRITPTPIVDDYLIMGAPPAGTISVDKLFPGAGLKVSGVARCGGSAITFTPDDPLEFSAGYVVTVKSAAISFLGQNTSSCISSGTDFEFRVMTEKAGERKKSLRLVEIGGKKILTTNSAEVGVIGPVSVAATLKKLFAYCEHILIAEAQNFLPGILDGEHLPGITAENYAIKAAMGGRTELGWADIETDLDVLELRDGDHLKLIRQTPAFVGTEEDRLRIEQLKQLPSINLDGGE